jgi:tetratricopeptide (TPR) repeat protein
VGKGIDLGPEAIAGVLATAARLQQAERAPGDAHAALAEVADAVGLTDATLARAHADHLLEAALAGLTAGDRRLMRATSFVAGLPGSLLGPPRPTPEVRVRAHMLARQAGAFRREKALRKAARLARQAIWLDPAGCLGWFQLGRVLEARGRFEAAADAYRAAVEAGLAAGPDGPEDPTPFADSLNNLAMLLEGAVDDAVPEAMYRRAMALKPTSGITPYNLGLMYKARGRLAEALACFEQAARLMPGDADTERQLAVVKAAQGS